MNVKIDTKEKFSVLTVLEPEFTANMTAEFISLVESYLQKDIPHLVVVLSSLEKIDASTCKLIADLQQRFYEEHRSFVICGLQPGVESTFDELALLELLNVTPTESEAWDIVQMEEIERELLGGES